MKNMILIILVTLASCSKDDTPQVTTDENYEVGFTYSYFNSADGAAPIFDAINLSSNLITLHYDEGIPWDEAYQNDYAAFPSEFRTRVDDYNNRMPSTSKVYLAVTPLSSPFRDGVASYMLDNGLQDDNSEWKDRAFNSDSVKTAFLNFCEILIEKHQPDYFSYSIETNFLWTFQDAEGEQKFIELAEFIYLNLKASHPNLPIFATFQVEHFYVGNRSEQEEAVQNVMAYSDYVGLSSYPFTDAALYPDNSEATPNSIPSNYFSAITSLSPNKQVAIAETGWLSETIDAPYERRVNSNLTYQEEYVRMLFEELYPMLNLKFVNWSFIVDYDQAWEEEISNDPNAAIFRIWKDTGFYDGDGSRKPALDVWEQFLRN